MKRIKSRLLSISFLLVSLLFFTGILLQFVEKSLDIKAIFLYLFWSIFSLYISLHGGGVDYQEDYLIRFYLFGKEKIAYKDIARIYTRPSPGMYVIESYDGKSYGLYIPLEHKRLSELFENITKANPDVIIDVSWYTKEPKKLFNDFIKIALFFIVVFIIDFVRRYIIKKFF